ncbi:hypothetical protein QVA66_03215 [Staphylococcus chromogenes]|nr:hypothetical protein [Staphylococcus chromogenes]
MKEETNMSSDHLTTQQQLELIAAAEEKAHFERKKWPVAFLAILLSIGCFALVAKNFLVVFSAIAVGLGFAICFRKELQAPGIRRSVRVDPFLTARPWSKAEWIAYVAFIMSPFLLMVFRDINQTAGYVAAAVFALLSYPGLQKIIELDDRRAR